MSNANYLKKTSLILAIPIFAFAGFLALTTNAENWPTNVDIISAIWGTAAAVFALAMFVLIIIRSFMKTLTDDKIFALNLIAGILAFISIGLQVIFWNLAGFS